MLEFKKSGCARILFTGIELMHMIDVVYLSLFVMELSGKSVTLGVTRG